MIGKKVKIKSGLFRNCEGTVESSFKHNGQEHFVVSFIRQMSDGELSKTSTTVTISDITII